MALDGKEIPGGDAFDDLDLDLDAAIGAAEELAGAVGGGLDLDEVLNADSGAEHLGSGARAYDFNRPHNISRAFEQNLQAVGEHFAKTGTIDFTSLLRMTTVVEYRGVRQCTFGEYQVELPNPTCAAMVTLAPFKGQSLLHLDLGLCFVFLKKLMGGTPEAEDSLREFTEIERGINAGLVGRFLEIFRKSVVRWLPVEPHFITLENNPNYLSGIADGEMLIIQKFQVRMDTVEGPVELALPLAAFGPVRDIFDPQDVIELRTPHELREDRRKVLELIQGTDSQLTVQLGEYEASLEDVMKLAPGDILHLPQAVEAPLKVQIAGQDAWLGEAGRVGQNRAVKLIQKLTKE